MDLIIQDLRKSVTMFLGFIVMSFGIVLIKESQLGLFPWGVFHEGLAEVLPLSFGQITSYLGFVILLFSVLVFKTNVGPGTILNILLVGPMIDLIDHFVNLSIDGYLIRSVFFIFGILLMTLGKALYISSKLGAGPRDGLFVGVSRVLQVEVKYVKPSIELIVVIAGYFLGGTVGIGTVITMFLSGYLVQMFFAVFKFESRKDRQRNLLDYIDKNRL